MLSNKKGSLIGAVLAVSIGILVVHVNFVITGEDIDKVLQQVKLIGEPFFVVPCVGGITV